MITRTALSLAVAICAALPMPAVHAGQVQVKVVGSPNSNCCGTIFHESFYEQTYNNSYELPPNSLQFAHEGATVSADLVHGTVLGKSNVSNTGNSWLASMSETFRVKREAPGVAGLVPVVLWARVNASSTLNEFGDVFSTAIATTRLELGWQSAFGLSDVQFAQFRWQDTIDNTSLGGVRTTFSQPTGSQPTSVIVDSASTAGFSVILRTTYSVYLSATDLQSAELGMMFFEAAELFGSAGGGGVFDASHTAQIFIDLPPGFGISSASGLFLSQPPLPVPEPSMALLLLAGLGLLAGRAQLTRR